ncbi:MAG: hypothetical protein D6778_07685 [Nitrospirae bacterium]|nr:MAG: hypothetical protein D6778_07685 [Nitrospirota bacterium]
MIFLLAIVFLLVILPADVLAWGPITHMYLGTEVLGLAMALPPAVYKLLRRHHEDFLYGNLMADSILWKKYLPETENSHSWQTGFRLLKEAKTGSQKAFVYGYLSHLAADTVVHGWAQRPELHIGIELLSDAHVGKRYWLMAVTIDRNVRKRHDLFLERNLLSPVVSVRTSKRLYKGLIVLSGLTPKNLKKLPVPFNQKPLIEQLHQEALNRVFDVIQKGPDSEFTRICPFPEK